jgi:hypothetical protein
MRKLIELDSVAAVEEVARRIVIPGTSIVTSRRRFADNDAAYEDPAKEAEAWARHALAANGFGDPAISDSARTAAASTQSTSYELYRPPRTDRSFTMAEIIVTAIEAVVAFARRPRPRQR